MSDPPPTNLTHLDPAGDARMVDIGSKTPTPRSATAEAVLRVSEPLLRAIREDELKKGDALGVARIAGIQAAKRTDELIPLCHSLPLDSVEISAELGDAAITLTATARTTWKTGVEMEALTAASVAALTVIDMGKSVDRGIVIERVRLRHKTGGSRGDYHAPPGHDPSPAPTAGVTPGDGRSANTDRAES